MRQPRFGLSFRAVAWHTVLLMAATAATQMQAFAGPTPPLPCSVPPQVAAVSFFEFVESPNGEEKLRRLGTKVLSQRLTRTTSQQAIIEVVRSARQQYSFDKHEVPLSKRLAGEPQLLNPRQEGFNSRAEVSVRILALSSRGSVEQRVSLACEESVWKVVSFSYGPAGK